MRMSFALSLILHGLFFCALFFQWHSSSRMHLPEKVYSVRVLGSLRTRTVGGAPARREGVRITDPKAAPKKLARGEGPKAAVPKSRVKKQAPGPAPQPAGAGAAQGRGGSADEGPGGPGIEVDAAQFPFGYFLSAIERRVSDNWYAAAAPRSGLTCVVYFLLMRDGSIRDIRVEKSSGSEFFDRSAVRAVKSASPFPPLPRGFQENILGIHFTFVAKE